MNTQLPILNLRYLLAVCLALAAFTCFAAAAAESPPRDSSALLRLQDLLDQQTKRIDRLYRAIGPHLEDLEERAAEVEKRTPTRRSFELGRMPMEDFKASSCGSGCNCH